VEVSPDLISRVTDAMLEAASESWNRSLEAAKAVRGHWAIENTLH
jgi:transposase-like protein